MKKRNIIIIVVSVILLIVLGTVFVLKNEKKAPVDDKVSTDIEIPKVEKKVTVIDVNSKSRPYAVMINTHNAALPQAGLQDAYLVYELMVEGGITRMMALFKDKDISKVGSVRSARTQYLGYVYENDAIYMHAGGAEDALNRISNEGINDVDVDGIYGERDRNLNRAWEHTLFTNSKLIKNGINARGMREDTDTPNLLKYQAESLDLNSYVDKEVANNISIKYSDYRTSEYSYDADSKMYLRSMNGKENTDLVTGKQYMVKNVIAYGVNYSTYTHHGYYGYQKIDNIGTGEGYYFTEGYAIPITWEKNSEKEQTKYRVKATNDELILNDGNTYIQIYPTAGYLNYN